MMVWGKIKTGKTTLAASTKKPIFYLAEPGHMTVRKKPHVTLFPIDKRGNWRPPRWEDAGDFLFYLRHADHDHDLVSVDSMSGFVRGAQRFILRDEEERDEFRPPDTMTQPTWGRLNGLVLTWLEELEEICQTRGMHLVLTAHERASREDDQELEGDIVPDLTPQIRREIVKRPAIVARTFVEEDEEDEDKLKYGMIFRDPDLLVGERITPAGEEPWLPRYAYNVTIPKLVRRIQQKSEEKK